MELVWYKRGSFIFFGGWGRTLSCLFKHSFLPLKMSNIFFIYILRKNILEKFYFLCILYSNLLDMEYYRFELIKYI